MKFLTEAAFWHTINKWIRDGSNLYAVSDGAYGTFVDLMGTDGCKEELVLYNSQEDYDADTDHVAAAE